MHIQVSLGEILDKYSILELKHERIAQDSKRHEIHLEMQEIYPHILPYMQELALEYRLLKYINGKIWDMNESYSNMMSFDGKPIMEENNARFRIKSRINIKGNSFLKEQKSYNPVQINIQCSLSAADTILYAQYAYLYHDLVFIVVSNDIPLAIKQELAALVPNGIYIISNTDSNAIIKYIDMAEIPLDFINAQCPSLVAS